MLAFFPPIAVAAGLFAGLLFEPSLALSQPPAVFRLDTIERIDTASGPVWTLRERESAEGWTVGAAFVCAGAGGAVQVVVYLGPFPADGSFVQLAVRTPDGDVVRFGPVVDARERSGSHNVSLALGDEQRRFVGAALRSGSLVSNGFRSFVNAAPPGENQALAEGLRDCGL